MDIFIWGTNLGHYGVNSILTYGYHNKFNQCENKLLLSYQMSLEIDKLIEEKFFTGNCKRSVTAKIC